MRARSRKRIKSVRITPAGTVYRTNEKCRTSGTQNSAVSALNAVGLKAACDSGFQSHPHHGSAFRSHVHMCNHCIGGSKSQREKALPSVRQSLFACRFLGAFLGPVTLRLADRRPRRRRHGGKKRRACQMTEFQHVAADALARLTL